MKTNDLITLAAIGAGAFILFKLFKPAQAAVAALNNVGSAIGSGLFDLFHPDQLGEMVFYTVTFPNGTRHAIGSRTVNSAGRFEYALPPQVSRTWQLLIGKDGLKYATPV